MNIRCFIVIFFILGVISVQADTNSSYEDSLRHLIANEPDSLKVHHFFELGKVLSYSNLDEGIPPMEKAFELAGQLNKKELQAIINYELAGLYWHKGLNYKAMQLDRATFKIYESLSDTAGMGKTLMGIGVSYMVMGLNELALDHFTHALEYARITKNKELQIKTYLNMSALVSSMGKMELSHTYVNKGLELSGTSEEFEKSRGILLVNKASYFNSIGDQEMNLKLLELANDIFDVHQMTSNRITSSMSIAINEFDREGSDKKGIIQRIDSLCKESSDFGDYPALVSGLDIWVYMLMDFEEYYAAEILVDSLSSLCISMEMNDSYLSSLRTKAKIFQETGRHAKSSNILEKFITLKDSLNIANNQTQLSKVMSFLELDRKNLEINKLKSQMANDRVIDDQKTMILSLLLVLIVILIVVFFFFYRNMKTIEGQKRKLKHDNSKVKRSNKRLNEQQELLKELNENLIIEKAVANKATKSKANFLSTMSHELRTPLNGILGISKVMQGSKMNKEEVKENLDILDFSANNLLSLINDILDYSKLDEKKVSLERKEENLPTYIEKLERSVRISAQNKGLELRCSTSENLPKLVYCDITRINQVMNNLLNNAMKFTHQGSVSIGVQLLQRIERKATIRFSVKDTGIGISEENSLNIFERFAQAEASTTRKYGGSGLGLSICKSLVELMDSELVLESEIGKGSLFYFDIELDEIEISENAGMSGQIDESNIEEEDWNDLNVLVVDDNEINRTVIGGMLGLYDISVGYAENGQLAVEAVKNGDYNCILMDIQMPVMDGYYATALIRKTHPEITIIALTAGGFEEFNSDIRSGDFNDFLRKPVVIEKILEVLQKTLHQVKAK